MPPLLGGNHSPHSVTLSRNRATLDDADHRGGGGDRGEFEPGAREERAKLRLGALQPAREVHHRNVEILTDRTVIAGRNDAFDDKQSALRRNDLAAVVED